jgi:hypothetical protein
MNNLQNEMDRLGGGKQRKGERERGKERGKERVKEREGKRERMIV